jgi:capsular exopolysaccharide synthesis family protein
MELEQYYRILIKRWWLIVLLVAVGTGSAYYYTTQQPPIYRSTATLLLSPALTSDLLFSEETVTNRLAQTYSLYLQTRAFTELVIEKEGLAISSKELIDSINTQIIEGTQFFEITATSNTPERAQTLANVISNYFIQEIVAQQQAQEKQRIDARQVDPAQELLREKLERERQYYEARVKGLRKEVEALLNQPPDSARDEQLDALQSLLSDQEERLLAIMTDLVALQSVVEQVKINTVTLVEDAPLPRVPVNDEALQNILFAFAASAVVGAALAFGLEYIDYTIRSPEELEQLYGEPPLGVLIRLREKGLITLKEPRNASSEAFRALRTNIQFSIPENPIKSFVITSAGPSEGKSTIASNLAVVMAQAGKQVILVDADLRRPRLHRQFELPNKKGLSNLIVAADPHDELEAYLQAGPVENLRILTSGPRPHNPAELLAMPRTVRLQEILTEKADLVIYDTPPVATVTDAAILATRTDGALLVVRASQTRRDLVHKGYQTLQRVRVRILGLVLNGVERQDIGYYYYYYYSGYDNKDGAELKQMVPQNGHHPAKVQKKEEPEQVT